MSDPEKEEATVLMMCNRRDLLNSVRKRTGKCGIQQSDRLSRRLAVRAGGWLAHNSLSKMIVVSEALSPQFLTATTKSRPALEGNERALIPRR
jgi:hypothetical protein